MEKGAAVWRISVRGKGRGAYPPKFSDSSLRLVPRAGDERDDRRVVEIGPVHVGGVLGELQDSGRMGAQGGVGAFPASCGHGGGCIKGCSTPVVRGFAKGLSAGPRSPPSP